MFETFKIYTHKEISLNEVSSQLAHLGYRRVDDVTEEGDYSVRGDVLEVFCANFNFPVRMEWTFEIIDKIYSFDKTIQKKLIDYDFLIVIPYRKKIKKYTEDIPLDIVLKIKKGDFVVHTQYGIGRFLGVKKMEVKGAQEYFFAIEYADNAKLYIAKEQAHLVQKYVSFTSRAPKLSKLGTKEWSRLKERAQNGIRKFALELLRMEAQRKLIGGFRYGSDTDWQKQFEDLFSYQETEDQLKATAQLKKHMESNACMDMLVCGDNGYGKTEVAMRAAFKAVMGGKQVAFLVPTTILAYQHYINLKERTRDFPVEVQMLSRFRTGGEQKDIARRLAEGKIEIIVGTHRLLSKDIAFCDLGLLIIDEEHRFGVLSKERIKKIKIGIDVLTLTATPIPRTLYMGLIGIKDIALIRTPPKERLAVKTEVMEFSSGRIHAIITKEVRRRGQVFFIHNRIESIYKIEKKLKSILPGDIRIAVIHGRMRPKEIEKIMLQFIEKEVDVLLSTAIVESGIDIPGANTIIVNDAHRFGLSDLHQLRGRVGRSTRQGYAYFVVGRFSSLSTDAEKRLRLLEEFSHLGAGFEVAMSDLELRGAGNLLGTQQHGFVWMIGFDLYCRLLKKEIEYLKNTFKIEIGG